MKVLIVTTSSNIVGGISNFFEVLKGKFSHPIDYFIRGPKKKYSTCRKIILAYIYFINIFQFIFKIRKFKIVHLNTSLGITGFVRDGIYLILAKIFRKKVLVFFHGLDIKMQKKIENSRLFRMIFFKSDTLVVLSSDFRNKLQRWGYKKEIFLGNTVIDEKWINDIDFSYIENKLSSKKESFTILFLSRVIKEKGIFELLDGFQLISKEYMQCQLIIVGDGKELEKMKSYTLEKKINNVEYTGFLHGKEKYDTFKNADLFILPSYTEGMPTVLIEAMAFGLPVIASNVGGIPDLIKSDEFGSLLKEISPEEIKNTIEFYINNHEKIKKIAFHNHQYVKENLTATEFAKKLDQVYQRMMIKN